MSTTLLLRPDLEHQRYRLTCRITVDAPLRGIKTEAWKDYARHELRRLREQFIRDMEHQGWRHVDARPELTGPFAHIDPRGIPNKPNVPKRRRGEPSIPIHRIDHTDWNYYTEDVRPIAQHEQWDYELKESFARRMLVEVPDIGPKSEMTAAEYLKETA
ncbi:MAG: hypothetical protein ACRESF_17705 [Pseudomonas sp.]